MRFGVVSDFITQSSERLGIDAEHCSSRRYKRKRRRRRALGVQPRRDDTRECHLSFHIFKMGLTWHLAMTRKVPAPHGPVTGTRVRRPLPRAQGAWRRDGPRRGGCCCPHLPCAARRGEVSADPGPRGGSRVGPARRRATSSPRLSRAPLLSSVICHTRPPFVPGVSLCIS